MLKETNQQRKRKKDQTYIPCNIVERLRQGIWGLAQDRTQINPLSPVTLALNFIIFHRGDGRIKEDEHNDWHKLKLQIVYVLSL